MVHAVETNLRKLLEGTKQYQVPLYQRTYSWKADQLRRLWDDLVKLAEDRRDRGQGATHFIGSMVLAPSPSVGPAGVQEFLVVDGQQRLTTLTLLLAAIRDHRSETENPSHYERVNEKYLLNKWEEDQPLKLSPTQADRSSYNACIRRTHQAGSADPVGTAYRFFRARLGDLDDPDDDLDIQRLEEAVISGLSLVAVTAQAGDNVHRIFESLNNTGRSWTPTEVTSLRWPTGHDPRPGPRAGAALDRRPQRRDSVRCSRPDPLRDRRCRPHGHRARVPPTLAARWQHRVDPRPDLPVPLHQGPQAVVAVLERRHLKFHEYDLVAPTPHLDELIDYVANDRSGIFWG